jgi:thioredoxin reductase
MGLIRNAVEQGRQAAEAIVRGGRRGQGGGLDVVVVGAGPAGTSATLGLMAHGWRVELVEQERYGGTIRHYPRAKIVMTGAIELPGFGTLRRRTMTKEQLLEIWDDMRARTALPVREGVRVERLTAVDGGWEVIAGDWSTRAATVVLALGRRGAPRRLGVPGEDLAKVSYRVIEPEPFAGQHVLVVGGGNAAADCALGLVESGLPVSVGLSYRRHELARMRSSVRDRVEAAFASGALIPHLGTEVIAIDPEQVMLRSATGLATLRNDAVVVQIGGTAPRDLLHSIGIELVDKRAER